ncbi:hypothetical protein LSH36_44g02077 [Paralvinella palmiformis]|uniref:Uncharacterized protein n=1 Tax=Paralvinella palmiformis TaxID=53620 RepID=A0AAD9NDD9_9ANNE|nr:hypothetical protein LSH36_44g02077 [Paralvinella palmiformis]
MFTRFHIRTPVSVDQADLEPLYESPRHSLCHNRDKLKKFLISSPGVFIGLLAVIAIVVLVVVFIRSTQHTFPQKKEPEFLVRTPCGLILGFKHNGVFVFKLCLAIPFNTKRHFNYNFLNPGSI